MVIMMIMMMATIIIDDSTKRMMMMMMMIMIIHIVKMIKLMIMMMMMMMMMIIYYDGIIQKMLPYADVNNKDIFLSHYSNYENFSSTYFQLHAAVYLHPRTSQDCQGSAYGH